MAWTTIINLVISAVSVAVAIALLVRLRQARNGHQRTVGRMMDHSRTVDRLLEFSQTIQGAGLPDQVLACLGQYLHSELGLSGLVIVAHEPEAGPPRLKLAHPTELIRPGCSVAEMDTGLCPCLRQNLPRQFKPEAAPVRCSIDAALRLPLSHPAYCVPFNVGHKTVILVHMLLPPEESWSEERRHLAQTYINAASSSLIMLHHLREAEQQSMTDALTGLYNRRSLEQLMTREVALSERHGVPLSVVMIDLDRFKEINDRHGHAAGDHLLKAFADCVRITLRKTDLAFRYGGDEFVIALPQTPLHQAEQVVQKLKQAFAAVDFSDAIANLAAQPTLSIGVAQRTPSETAATLPSLLAAADTALYEAKKNNRDCIKVHSPQRAA
jgi:diguanylate cyclase (GGDEF)-like protein